MKTLILVFILLSFQLSAQVTGTTSSGRLIIKKKPVQKTQDQDAPVLTILDPAIKENEEINANTKNFKFLGQISDESEIVSFNINNIPHKLTGNNNFEDIFDLSPGLNQITLTATDKLGNTGTYMFSVLYRTDYMGPSITIVSPKIKEGQILSVKESTRSIIIETQDPGGIKEVIINNQSATTTDGKRYFLNVKLNPGINNISISASDNQGNYTTKAISLNYEVDAEPPQIVIKEPAVGRGIKIVSKKEVVAIKGKASDKSGVYSVTINGRSAALMNDGSFTLDMNLSPGENAIVVKAVDNAENCRVDTFFITRKIEDLISKGKYYALFIGIDNYKGYWPRLRNAVNDAKAIADLLRNEYYFDDIRSLYDEQATRSNIISELERLTSVAGSEDNVLIFYSGHGEFKQQLNKGFWVPVDASTNSIAGYISNNDIQLFFNGIRSKHTLLISDACFSGDIFRGRTEEMPFEDSDRYFQEVYRRTSRYALTSGGIEPVTDGGRDGHSVFTYYVLKKLQENQSRYFTAGQLFNEIQIPVTNNSEQSPNFQPIKNTGDEGGQFIFIKKMADK